MVKTKDDANMLRKKIQIENQEVYSIKIILTIYSYDLRELYKNLLSIKSKFYSKGIISEITNFRHLNYYLNNTPICLNKKINKKIYITTDALSNIFPFYIENIVDKGGIIFGKNEEKRLCMIDIFKSSYENSNICIFGCSGSGKSYFTKLMIIRNYYQGIKQIILDVEDEYEIISNRLNGQIVFNDKDLNYETINDELNAVINTNVKLLVLKMTSVINNSNIVEDVLKIIMKSIGKEKTIIYIDEVWKYSKSENVLSEIFNMYKTIRKRKASIVTITQDITDYFEYKDGKYAKSILNNTCFKIFFKTELNDIETMLKNIELDTNTSYMNKGEAILFVGKNNLKIKVQANEFERGILDAYDNSSK